MILNGIYEAILTRLTTATGTTLKHLDLDFGQYDQGGADNGQEVELPFNCPAQFIGFDDFETKTLGQGRQSAELMVTITTVSEVVQEVANRENTTIRNLGHAHLQLLDNTHALLQGWNGAVPSSGFKAFGSFDRQRFAPYKPDRLLIVHKMTYRVRVTDDAALKQYVKPANLPTPVTVTDDITVQQL